MISCISILLYGCGNTDKLDAYLSSMNTFNKNVSIITETMELIDEDKESAPTMVCEQLDKLVEQFRIMSELEIPEKYQANESLGDEAYNYIQEADKLYKQWAASPEDGDENLVIMARQNYDRAMKRVSYMSLILQGKTPEGEGVTVTEEDTTDFTPVIEEEIEEIEE